MGGSFNGFTNPKPDKGKSSNVKSIQKIYANIPWNAASVDYTINNIKKDNSVVYVTYGRVVVPSANALSVQLISDTKVRIARNITGSSLIEQPIITVVEFNNVKSRQEGVSQGVAGWAKLSVPISEINTEKSMLIYSIQNSSSSTPPNAGDYIVMGDIETSNLLSFLAIATALIYWQVIEFN